MHLMGGTAVLGDGVRTPSGQSGSLCGLELAPTRWRGLVPGERRDGAQSHPPAPPQTTPGHTHRVLRKRKPLGNRL